MIFCFNAGEVFRIAVQIEENGKAFYEKAQSVIEDAEVKKLFADLALEEVEHKKKFQDLMAQFPPSASTPTVSDPDNQLDQYIQMMADQHIFGTTEGVDRELAGVRNAVDALKMALQFEKDSVIFFLGMQEATCEGKDRDLIHLLVKEEQEHVRRLSLQLRRLTR
ncbi:MAG: ferritin family protein [Syntrophobacteraceae bacterium]|jgi:rubrerythrin|nr:ferritin family protein [Syntrophobacteraceae bacterium]